jgi:hypothetical protein
MSMTKPLASPAQLVNNTLANHIPVRCAVCDRYVASFTGRPVILDDKAQIIEFAHPDCCDQEEE